MQYKFVEIESYNAQREIDRYASLGWKVISIAATNLYIYIVFGKD